MPEARIVHLLLCRERFNEASLPVALCCGIDSRLLRWCNDTATDFQCPGALLVMTMKLVFQCCASVVLNLCCLSVALIIAANIMLPWR